MIAIERASLCTSLRQSLTYATSCANSAIKNLRLGFVPTMGALHDRHLSLVDIAQKTSDGVIISIL